MFEPARDGRCGGALAVAALAVAVLALCLLLPAMSLASVQPGEETPGSDEQPAADSPEAAFEALMASMRAGDWLACARLMHPEALAEFHGFFTSLAEVDESGEVARGFFGVDQAADLAELSPEEGFARVMRAMVSMTPGMDAMFRTATATILGTVPEDDVVHVVYRMHMEMSGTEISKIAVAPFKPYEGEWRGLLTGEMEGIIQGIKAQMAQ